MNFISQIGRIVLAFGFLISADAARSETLDSIEITRRGNEAEINIHFTTPAQYLRHSPRDNGKLLNIDIQLVGIGSRAADLEDLVRTIKHSPQTDMVPRFTVTYPATNGSMMVEFDQPTRFSVRPGHDGRSLSIWVPILPGAKDWVVEAKALTPSPSPSPSPATQTPAPAVPPQSTASAAPAPKPTSPPAVPPAPAISVPAPSAPIATRENSARPQLSPVATPSTPIVPAIELIDVQRRGKEAEIILRFTTAIQYGRHTSLDAGRLLRIFTRLNAGEGPAPGAAAQSLRLPENDMVPRFTVNYPDAENALAIAFDQPTRFTVRQGADNRSIIVVVPVLANAQDWSVQTRPSTGVAAMPAMAPQQAIPSAVAPAAQERATPVKPIAAPAPSPPVATVAEIPTSPSATSPTAAELNLPVLTPLSKDEIENRAKEWMDAAHLAIDSRNGVIAAARINQVLSLPPNSHTEAANALMGEAREYSGELRRAVAEYESYLKNYPKGEFVPRVKERLAAINKTVTVAEIPSSVGLKPGTGSATGVAAWSINGGISQYYYTGNSKIETITPPPPGQLLFNRDTLSLTDQRSLISSIDLSARKRDNATDTRIVVRETDNRNYLEGQSSYSRLYAAYVEQTNKEVGYFFRAGRQLGIGGGVLGRFDGLSVGYNLNPSWRINAVVGSPAEFRDPFRRSVYGASVDYLPQLGRPGISAYYVEQTLEGVKDRQAIGSEVRYFDQHLTVFSLLDYDINFQAVNIAMMQANLRTASGTNYFANLDIRRTPPLSFTTALPGQISQDPFQPTLDFRSLFQSSMTNLGVDQLRNEAATLTAVSSFYTLGFIHPVTPRWQLGADYRQSNIAETGTSGILPAQPGSGTSHVVSGQALGNSLLLTNDAFIANGSAIFAPLYTGQNYNLAYIVPVSDWRFDALLGYYYQTDNQSQRQTRLTPTARIVYRLKNRLTFELDAGSEIFDETGPIREQHSRRTFIYGGYRWDFN